MQKEELSAETLRELLDYDKETGVFTRRLSKSNTWKVGEIAGFENGSGYRKIRVKGVLYYEHRLAWLHVYGEWPKTDIDHINNKKTDNRIFNLRVVNDSQNRQNTYPSRRNTSGYKGVSRNRGKWESNIIINGKKIHLGRFSAVEMAAHAYAIAASKYHTHNPMAIAGDEK